MKFEKLSLDKFKKTELGKRQSSVVYGGEPTATYVVSFNEETGEQCDSSVEDDSPRRSSRVKLP